MPSTPFEPIDSHFVVLPKHDIDTDQIIPARFLKTIERSGLGAHAFNDWRYDASGAPRDEFPLNDARAAGAKVLVAGRNFGCGSSREHAVWALMAAGFRAVVSSAFADIFRGNAIGNGLVPIQVEERIVKTLIDTPAGGRVRVNLAEQQLVLPDGTAVGFPIDAFAKRCILEGVDELDVLLGEGTAIDAYELNHPSPVSTIAEVVA